MKRINIKTGPVKIFHCSSCHRLHFEYKSTIMEMEYDAFWKFTRLILDKNMYDYEKGKITITLVKQQIYLVIKMQDYHFVQDAVSRVSSVLKMDYLLSQGILVPDDYNANDLKSVTGSKILN